MGILHIPTPWTTFSSWRFWHYKGFHVELGWVWPMSIQFKPPYVWPHNSLLVFGLHLPWLTDAIARRSHQFQPSAMPTGATALWRSASQQNAQLGGLDGGFTYGCFLNRSIGKSSIHEFPWLSIINNPFFGYLYVRKPPYYGFDMFVYLPSGMVTPVDTRGDVRLTQTLVGWRGIKQTSRPWAE